MPGKPGGTEGKSWWSLGVGIPSLVTFMLLEYLPGLTSVSGLCPVEKDASLMGTLHAQGRCGYGPRLPLLAISPWSKKNYIDSTVTDQTSIVRFIEGIFLSGERIGGGSFDSIAGTLSNMFDFGQRTPQNGSVVLLDDTTGEVTRVKPAVPIRVISSVSTCSFRSHQKKCCCRTT
jgi:hypothetical protein